MRNAFASEITSLSKKNDKIVLLSGDIGNRLFDEYKSENPKKFYNCGVAEQNMTGVAAGLAMNGMRPVTYTITPFLTTRCLEQIKIDICYNNLPVTIVSVGAGLSYAGLGPTHHSCEDISFLRSLPNMKVICPADAFEVKAALRASFLQNSPVYIRMGKKGEPLLHKHVPSKFIIGKSMTIKKGKDICIIFTGNIMSEALSSLEKLEKLGFFPELVNFHTIKPLDKVKLKTIFKNFKYLAIIEEHSLIGGLSSSISEWFVDNIDDKKTKILRFGTPDVFYKEAGSQSYARKQLNICSDYIVSRIVKAI